MCMLYCYLWPLQKTGTVYQFLGTETLAPYWCRTVRSTVRKMAINNNITARPYYDYRVLLFQCSSVRELRRYVLFQVETWNRGFWAVFQFSAFQGFVSGV